MLALALGLQKSCKKYPGDLIAMSPTFKDASKVSVNHPHSLVFLTAILCFQVGASREKLFTLRNELDALCLFANSVSFRVPPRVYQRLCETAASFS